MVKRRTLVLGAAATPLLQRFAAAQSAEPLRIGWLAALTGPSSAPGIGFNRGVTVAAAELNAEGGVRGRPVEIVMRDTQGDPAKAANATEDLISRAKVHAIWGPTNSGEAMAAMPIMARVGMPCLHPCVLDSLIDPEKYPSVFRIAPSNGQWDDAVRGYVLNMLGVRDVAVFGDTTGYGTSAVTTSAAAFGRDGARVVSQSLIDATRPDVTPDMLSAQAAGAGVLVAWSASVGLLSRLMNVRRALRWNVPIVGHPSLGSGEIRGLLDRPGNWERVFMVSYRSCSVGEDGKLPERSQAFVAKLAAAKVALNDTSLWWVACGYDAVRLVAAAVESSGASTPDAITGAWNQTADYPGMFGDYSFDPGNHNGYPQSEVVMSCANSQHDGTFALAPGVA
jgi:branched-chain amino acid transport system substrate-binding protein